MSSIKVVSYCLSFNSLFESLHLEFCSPSYGHFPKAGQIGFDPKILGTNSILAILVCRLQFSFLMGYGQNLGQLSIGIKFRSFGPSYTKLWPNEKTLFIWSFLYSGSVHYPDLTWFFANLMSVSGHSFYMKIVALCLLSYPIGLTTNWSGRITIIPS